MPLPAPRTWEDGEDPENIPTADDLNLDWRDSFNFLVGNTRPIAYLQSSTTQAMAANTPVSINFQIESLKRGGMVHAVNGATVTVPYAGQYVGFMYGSAITLSTLTTRLALWILINGVTTGPRVDGSPIITDHQLHGSFTLNLAANDTVGMQLRNTAGTATTSNLSLTYSKLAIWYVGDF
jgi:hypothetical protein